MSRASTYMTEYPTEIPVVIGRVVNKDGTIKNEGEDMFTIRSDSLFIYYQLALDLGAASISTEDLNILCETKLPKVLEELITKTVMDPPIFVGEIEATPPNHLNYSAIRPTHRIDIFEAITKSAESGGTVTGTFHENGGDAEDSSPIADL